VLSRVNRRADFGNPRSLAIPLCLSYAAMFSLGNALGTLDFSPAGFKFLALLRALCVLCANPVFGHIQKRIAPSREEGALTPRCLSSLCSLCANPVFLLRHANLKVGVPRRSRDVHKRIAPSRKEGALTPRCCACERSQGVPRAFSGHSQAYRAVARRSGAYAAMLRSGTLPRRSQTFPVNTPGRPVI